MVTFEQVKLLETKVAKTIDFVGRITEENTLLRGKLETYQKRIGELEVLIQRFKEDQSSIEEGFISTLDRLSRFEAAMEQTISPVPGDGGAGENPPEAGSAPGGAAPLIEELSAAEPAEAGLPAEEAGAADFSEPPDTIYAAEQPDEAFIFEPEAEEDAGLAADEDAAPADDGVDPAELDIF
jgi:hypothetical protein